jgi:hypothetical protein
MGKNHKQQYRELLNIECVLFEKPPIPYTPMESSVLTKVLGRLRSRIELNRKNKGLS